VLDQAYVRNPERFVRARPNHPPQPTAVWITPPNVFEARYLLQNRTPLASQGSFQFAVSSIYSGARNSLL
jgi:hypothetical protein